MPSTTTVAREGRAAVVHLRGDLVVPTARNLYAMLRTAAKRRDVRTLVLDFSGAGRIDSSGIAVIELIGKQLASAGKKLDFAQLGEQHRAAFELAPAAPAEPPEPEVVPGFLERFGEHV